MRVNELREMGSGDLATRLDEAKEELFNLRFQNATGQLENYKRLSELKRDIARIATVVREREIGIEIEPKDLPPPRARRRKKDEDSTDVPVATSDADDEQLEGAEEAPAEVPADEAPGEK